MIALMNNPSNGVIRKMFTEAQSLRAAGRTVYDFTLGNPDLDAPRAFIDSLIKHSSDSHGYMPNAGYDFTRDAMAKKTNIEQSSAITAANVVMAVGAAGALNCIFRAVLDAGDEVIVPSPYFGEYKRYAENVNAKLIAVKTKDNFQLDISAIKNALSARTKIILLNSPNNPTGVIYSKDEIEQLCDTLKEVYSDKNGTRLLGVDKNTTSQYIFNAPYIVLDEPYRAITFDKASVPAVFPLYERAIVATSFAKSFSIPGERLGYIAVNTSSEAAQLVSALTLATRILGFVNAPALAQRAICDCWNAEVDYSRYATRRAYIMKILDDNNLKYVTPTGAFYIFPKIPDEYNGDDMKFCEHLKDYGILCAPGSGFGAPGYFRIAYCVDETVILDSAAAWRAACRND